MSKTVEYRLEFAPEVVDHLRAIERKHHGLIRQVTEEQLTSVPEVETRNRKPLEQPAPAGATWELRFGPENRFRVFYTVVHEGRTVQILAVGVKLRNRLRIGDEEIEL